MEAPLLLIARHGATRNLLEALLEEEGLRWQASDTDAGEASAKAPILRVCQAHERVSGLAVPRFVVASGNLSLAPYLEAGTRDGMAEDKVHAAPDECRIRLQRCFGTGGAAEPSEVAFLTLGPWRLNVREGTLTHRQGLEFRLTPTETRLAEALLTGRGRVLSHEQLMSRVWADRDCQASDLLKRYVSRLRRRLGDLGWSICNLPGHGYAWRET